MKVAPVSESDLANAKVNAAISEVLLLGKLRFLQLLVVGTERS